MRWADAEFGTHLAEKMTRFRHGCPCEVLNTESMYAPTCETIATLSSALSNCASLLAVLQMQDIIMSDRII
jgi:hypothetical protein